MTRNPCRDPCRGCSLVGLVFAATAVATEAPLALTNASSEVGPFVISRKSHHLPSCQAVRSGPLDPAGVRCRMHNTPDMADE